MKIKIIYDMNDPQDREDFEEFTKLDKYSITIHNTQNKLREWGKYKIEQYPDDIQEAFIKLIDEINEIINAE